MRKLTLFLCLLVWSQSLFANELVDEAVKAQSSQDYPKAIELYKQVLKDGIANGHIYYNLGNAYFRVDKKGEAMAAYLAARSLLPRDPDVALNIKHVKKDLVDKLDTSYKHGLIGTLVFWSGWFSLSEHVFTFGFLMLIAGSLFLLGILKSEWRMLKTMGVLFWILAAIVGIGATVHWQQDGSWGATTVELASVYSGPAKAGNSVLFELHEASPFVVLEKRDGWLRIGLSDGKQGWIPRDQVEYYKG